MFPTQSKVRRLKSNLLWFVPVAALALLFVALLAFGMTASAQNNVVSAGLGQVAGDFCIEGIVIDWEEEPLAGWQITLTNDVVLTTMSAPEPDDDDDDPDFQEGEFEFKEKHGLPQYPDVYILTIESREGWEGVTPTTITFPIEAGNDDCVKVRFKMRPIYPVTVIKFDVDHIGLEDWKIKAVPGAGNLFAEADEEETDETGAAFFTLTPGAWIFMEMPPKLDKGDRAEAWMPVAPPSGRQELDIDIDEIAPGTPLTVIFKNENVVGCVAVQKLGAGPVVDGETETFTVWGTTSGFYGVPGWGFQLLRKDGSVARQGVTDATGRLEFDNLPLGPYIIVEENRAGWNEITARKIDVDVTGNLCDLFPDPEDPTTLLDPAVIFENEQDDSGFCVEGYKVDANGGYGIPDWKIKIKPLADEGYDPADVRTDGLGKFRFDFPKNDYRIPGAAYEICEEEKDGWLPHTDTCQTVVLPEWPMGECVQLKDFVNQQVGHSESEKMEKMWDDKPMGGPQMGGPMDKGGKCSNYHEVKAGEGLFDIGKEYKRTPQQMLDANPDVRKYKDYWVFVGQKVCIP